MKKCLLGIIAVFTMSLFSCGTLGITFEFPDANQSQESTDNRVQESPREKPTESSRNTVSEPTGNFHRSEQVGSARYAMACFLDYVNEGNYRATRSLFNYDPVGNGFSSESDYNSFLKNYIAKNKTITGNVMNDHPNSSRTESNMDVAVYYNDGDAINKSVRFVNVSGTWKMTTQGSLFQR